ncbi:hypothetical protein NQZ68_006070 [Dissostichus eleginoides]|nr:hypothetical protein NQZ68_006070 [Dissostichus eleginoides]
MKDFQQKDGWCIKEGPACEDTLGIRVPTCSSCSEGGQTALSCASCWGPAGAFWSQTSIVQAMLCLSMQTVNLTEISRNHTSHRPVKFYIHSVFLNPRTPSCSAILIYSNMASRRLFTIHHEATRASSNPPEEGERNLGQPSRPAPRDQVQASTIEILANREASLESGSRDD